MQAVKKFPLSTDLAGLEAHFRYIEAERKRLPDLYDRSYKRPAWADGGEDLIMVTKHKWPSYDDKKLAIDMLIGNATRKGKRIIKVWNGSVGEEWAIIAQCENA